MNPRHSTVLGAGVTAVLLAHEDEALRARMVSALGAHGVSVTPADSARGALEAALSASHALVLLGAGQCWLDGAPLREVLRSAGVMSPVLRIDEAQMCSSQSPSASEPSVTDGAVVWRGPDAVAGWLAHVPASPGPAQNWDDLTFASLAGFERLQSRFRQRLFDQMPCMRECCEQGDWSQLARLAHGVKGGASCFEMPAMTEVAAALEAEALAAASGAGQSESIQSALDRYEMALLAFAGAPEVMNQDGGRDGRAAR